MTIIGIDPGVSGAIAVLRDHTAAVADLPVTQLGGMNVIDALALVEMLVNIGPVDMVVMEDNRARLGQGVRGAWSMGASFGIIYGVLAALERPLTGVKPKEWQATMGLTGVGSGAERKDAHRARARELYPMLACELVRRKDHDRADALLIAASWERR